MRFTIRSPEDVGRAIRRVRRDLGLSQAALAERAGVDRSYIAKIENGRSSRLLHLVLHLLRALDVEVTLTTRSRDRG